MIKLSKSERINKALKNMNILSYKDVLFHLPRKYEDYHPTLENNIKDGQRIVFVGVISSSISIRKFGKTSIAKFSFTTKRKNTFYIEAWNRPYLSKVFNIGEICTITGSYDLRKNIINLININKGEVDEGKYFKPIYSLNRDIDNFEYQRLVNKAFSEINNNDLWNDIPDYFRQKYRLLNKYDALSLIHRPSSLEDIRLGLRVLKYEECLLFSLKTQMIRNNNKQSFHFAKSKIDTAKIDSFIKCLSFQLTLDQKNCVNEIINDMNKDNLMYRLLQGDVGTGKTLVAVIAMYANYIRGDQSALMAPTDALAKQHYKNIISLFKPLGINVTLLVGSSSISERALVRKGLINKTIDVVIGTHVLFSKDINYLSLGLAIVDEQHKFGVNQRMLLASKGEHADLLLMSATPIPRTLALTLYGDLDVSTLSSFPFSKRDIETVIVPNDDKLIEKYILSSLTNDNRIFIVAPSIISNEKGNISVEDLYAHYLLKYPGKVALLHGNLSQDDKDFAIKDFINGKSNILISTSVIEVGIDVKKSNLMIIYDPTHFGLASLHQLRGRIGRDGNKSTCLLVSDTKDEEELEKLNVLVNSNDGFYVAEQDLKHRGPGELGGVRQSGIASFAFVNLVNDFRMFEVSREDAKFILNNSTHPDFKRILIKASKEIDDNKFTNA